jgi:hypothetical protein
MTRRHRAGRYTRPAASLVRDVVRLDNYVRGCRCKPRLRHHGRDHVEIVHRDGCPARHGTSIVAIPPEGTR